MSTNDRGRNQLAQGASASQPAQLPGIPAIPLSVDPALRRFLEAAKEHLEVRAGARGNPYEKSLTKRDLMDAGLMGMGGGFTGRGIGVGGALMVRRPDGSYAGLTIDEFADQLFNSRLYKDLVKRLDDPSRFDGFPDEVRAYLANSIAAEAAARGADIRSTESRVQTDVRSLAARLDEVTAAVEQSTAGVRTLTFAAADATRAQAGQITQIEARLNDVGGVTIEQSMTATADRVAGLAGEYLLKINAGGAVAGFGLAASEDPSGATSSSFLVQADTFALVPTVTFSQEATPTATAIGQTWFKPSTEAYYRATATGSGSWVVYTPVAPMIVDTTTGKVRFAGSVEVDGSLLATGTITTSKLVAGTMTGFVIQTGATGARLVLGGPSYDKGLVGYDAGGYIRIKIDVSDGTIYASNYAGGIAGLFDSTGTTAPCVRAINSGDGGGAGVEATSTTGVALVATGNATKAPGMLTPLATLPTDRSAGAICFYGGWLCFANGTHWYQSNGTQLT